MAVDVSETLVVLRNSHRPENAHTLGCGDHLCHSLQSFRLAGRICERPLPW